MPEKEPGFKLEKRAEKPDGLEKIRKGLETTLRALESGGEREKRGEMPEDMIKEFSSSLSVLMGTLTNKEEREAVSGFWVTDKSEFVNKFWLKNFPKMRRDFWGAHEEYAKFPSPKNSVEQSKPWNSTPNPLRGGIINGFKSIPEQIFLEKELKREIIVIDRERDKKLAKLCDWARGLKEKFPDEEERIFKIAQLVFKKMGGNKVEKINNEVEKMEKERKEILLGEIKYGQCRHRGLLFQVLASEAGLESILMKGIVQEMMKGKLIHGHAYNSIFSRTGEILIIDISNLPERWSKKQSYQQFKKKGGFPRFGSNRLPFGVYFDRKGRFQGGRLGVDGLKELLKKE